MFFIGSTATFHVGKYFRGQLNCDHGVVSYSASSATPWYFVFVDKDGISLIIFYETPTAGHLIVASAGPGSILNVVGAGGAETRKTDS